jgi:hypothetical protein
VLGGISQLTPANTTTAKSKVAAIRQDFQREKTAKQGIENNKREPNRPTRASNLEFERPTRKATTLSHPNHTD